MARKKSEKEIQEIKLLSQNSRVFQTYFRYHDELEEFISQHKQVPHNFDYWPHGPYWPKGEPSPVVRTPKHIRTVPGYPEYLVSVTTPGIPDSYITSHSIGQGFILPLTDM